jgi:rRNA-processing protein FCF1
MTTEEQKPGKKQVMLDKETLDFAKKHNIDINEAVKQHLERLKAAYKN